MDDSGPNLAVRGAGFLLVLAGLFLMTTGYRIRKGTSRLPVPAAMTIYGVGLFTVASAAAIVFGAIALGVRI